jgi:hypothetical protein
LNEASLSQFIETHPRSRGDVKTKQAASRSLGARHDMEGSSDHVAQLSTDFTINLKKIKSRYRRTRKERGDCHMIKMIVEKIT